MIDGLRPVPGHPGVFVTPGGRVFRELPAARSTGGYHTVKIPGGTIRRHFLMALAFLGPKPAPPVQVRHLDGDPANDNPANLAWGTPTENAADAIRHGRTTRGERNGQAKLSNDDAAAILARRSAGESGRSLAEEFGVTEAAVCDLFKGRTWPGLARK